jgi:YVTN family beta-propeller protein
VFVLNRGRLGRNGNPIGRGSVSVLDSSSGVLLRTVPVGVDPNAIVVDDARGVAFVVNGGRFNSSGFQTEAGSVSVVDIRTAKVVRTVPLGVSAGGASLDEPTGGLVVVNHGVPPRPGSASILDARGTTLRTLRVGVYPAAVAVESRLHRAFVVNLVSNTTDVIDVRRRRVVAVTRLGRSPGSAARVVASPRTARVFVLSFRPQVAGGGGSPFGRVQMLDARTARVVRSVRLADPTALAIDNRAARVLVTGNTRRGGRLTALTARSGGVIWSARVGRLPSAIAVDERAGRVYVASSGSRTITVLDATTGRTRCSVGVDGAPAAVAVDPRARRVFVVQPARNTVSVLRARC